MNVVTKSLDKAGPYAAINHLTDFVYAIATVNTKMIVALGFALNLVAAIKCKIYGNIAVHSRFDL